MLSIIIIQISKNLQKIKRTTIITSRVKTILILKYYKFKNIFPFKNYELKSYIINFYISKYS